MWFKALEEYPLPMVREALGYHVKRGTFTPVPADVVSFIEGAKGNDGRPGAEEAWAIALTSRDENDTIVWTAECAEAFARARPVLESSGAISARKTFLEVYEALVAAARKGQRPAVWSVHLGFDRSQHARVLTRAVEQGRLPAKAVMNMLPPPEDGPDAVPSGERLLLSGPKVPEMAPEERDKARAQLATVKKMLADSMEAKNRAVEAAIDRRLESEEQFKANLNRRVREHQAYIRMADGVQLRRAEDQVVRQAGEPAP
jgi:hypothetical protein